MDTHLPTDLPTAVAVIALAGRFPGAKDVEAFWRNLCDRVESISTFSAEDMQAAGVARATLDQPNYVPAGAILGDIDRFDAAFFGFNPREAELLDPQQRIFLETCWEALERAGYDPAQYAGRIGVFAGAFMSSYLYNIYSHPEIVALVGQEAVRRANDKDYLTTRVSYKLNLTGPSININTSCSTSLVAAHVAYQSLLNGECDIALAGGVSIPAEEQTGYLYREGDILSSDGHCRAFDARAQGTVFGSGVGVIVLKRLEDAITDGDTLHAIIRGSAVNNDGAGKIGFTAPSIKGQAEVIAEALAMAGCPAESIGYIETHGTGTPIGDPIEIAALKEVFSAHTSQQQFCAIASVKTNIGHLGSAAGIAGLIKTVLVLRHRLIPPSLHFERPNPTIDFVQSAFFVNTSLRHWEAGSTPRRAGVSSFGIGGTNAHMILEEAPLDPLRMEDRGWRMDIGDQSSVPALSRVEGVGRRSSAQTRPWKLLLLSAKTATALEAATDNLVAHLREQPDDSLDDIAYTLQVGRKAFGHRRALVCRNHADAIEALERRDPLRVVTATQEPAHRSVVFLFPGQGAQHVDMARELYDTEPRFRAEVDRCCELLLLHVGLDLRDILYPDHRPPTTDHRPPTAEGERGRGGEEESGQSPISNLQSPLDQTQYTQPALFVIEYALAKLWISWGVEPQAFAGHSIGEYVAACLAGVLSLEQALELVVLRGRLVQQLPPGAMLSIMCSEAQVRPLLGKSLSLAAINGPALCVVSGPEQAIQALGDRLRTVEIPHRHLHTSHAFHSAMLDSIVPAFTEHVARMTLNPPHTPYISNVTGTWITPQDATAPDYWARQLRQTVAWDAGIRTLNQTAGRILLEVGPGRTLTRISRRNNEQPAAAVLPSLGHPEQTGSDITSMLESLGRLWLAGVPIEWTQVWSSERRQRVQLPTYPFERHRYWIPLRQSTVSFVNAAQPTEGDQLEEPTLSLYEGPDIHSTDVAPQNELEQGIAEIYQQLLGIQSVGRFADFFELGGHSLLATQLMARLRDTYNVSLPMRNLLDAPTVAGIADAITAATSERSAAADVQVDAVLDSTIVIDLGQTAPATRFQHVLLTGATGFLGAFLLADLLKRTSAHVHCLVRADSADQAMERVEQALVGYDLWQGGYRSRITPIRGDLAAPGLGLSAEAWKMLGESVDAIIHNGAVVNFVTPYHRLKPANVLGTQEIIRLAARRGKPLHFVSSVGVLTAPPEQAIAVFDETFVGGPDRLHSGYARSKWVAEQLVRQAGQRGLPIAIYRPGNLAGHSVTGACNTNDFLIKNMQSWIELGIAPDLDALLDITPIDYVSAALVELAQRRESVGKTFHLVNPEPTRLRMIMEWMQHYGYQLALIPANRWQSVLVEQVEQHPDTALYPLLPMLIDRTAQNDTTTPSQGDTIAYGCQFTLAALKGTGITCPPMTEELLEIYFDYCIRKELLPSVAQTRAHQEGAL